MSDPTFGISITRIDNEPRPAVWSDMSVVGLIGTAPGADPVLFPANTPVFLYSDDIAKRHALGTTGTMPAALSLINAQLGEFQVAAKVVVVRVAEGGTVDETIANIVGDGISSCSPPPRTVPAKNPSSSSACTSDSYCGMKLKNSLCIAQ